MTALTMGSVDSESYFASLNPMANKLVQNRGKHSTSKYGSLGYEQERWVETEYLYDRDNSDSGDDSDDDSLPSLRIHGGERVVIDFDNNGWSWRDEHSAPFSWMTRSQEDLTLEEIFSKTEPPKSPKLPRVPPKLRDRPADEGGSSLIWNSPFVAADRGEEVKFKHAEDNLLAKYGVSLGALGDESNDKSFTFDDSEPPVKPVKTKRTSLADILQLGPEGIRQIRESRRPDRQSNTDSQYTSTSSLYSSSRELQPHSLSGSLSEMSYESKASSPDVTPTKPKKNKKKWWSPKKEKAAAKSALLAGVNIYPVSSVSATLPADLGQLSPVFIQDQGESCDYDDQSLTSDAVTITSTDSAVLPDETSFHSSEVSSFTGTSTTDEGFVNPALSTTLEEGDDLLTWETRTLTEEDQVAASTDDIAPKSGFDFLDNW